MNRIYCFTGTGNCLKLSQDIAGRIGDCEIISISNGIDTSLRSGYDRIGFVFPVYYQGLPLILDNFLKQIDLSGNRDAYFFAVATYGALAGNALPQIARQLYEKGISLHYGEKLVMFSNCVTMYNMNKQVDKITKRSDQRAVPVIEAIACKEHNRVPAFSGLINRYYRMQIGRVHNIGQGFHAGDRCNSCGLCKNVCPVGNITMQEGRPVFHNSCEHCTACIQYCPAKALNYKNLTQKRRRYHHPKINASEMVKFRASNMHV